MSATGSPRRWPLRVAGLIAVALFLVLVSRYWHPVFRFTAFIQLDAGNDNVKIAAFREMPVYVYRNTGPYDGLYYAQIAYHPSLRAAELRPAVDSLAYRARRILPSAIAWIVAGGNPAWIVHVYSVLNIVAWLVLAALLWRLLAVSDARGFLAWGGVMFSAGALTSVRFSLTDLVALAILAGAMLAAERNRRSWASGLVAAAALARETSLGALAGICDRPWLSRRNLGNVLVAVAPVMAWIFYVRWQTGENGSGVDNLTWPVTDYLEKWGAAIAALRTGEFLFAAWATVLATLALGVQAAFFFSRWKPADRWWRVGAVYATFMLFLSTPVWEGFPGAATRVVLPLGLAFNVLAHRLRASLVWMIAGNLTVIAGAIALVDVHRDPRELAAARAHGTALVATLGPGWYDGERSRSNRWAWSGGRSTVDFEAWPKGDGAAKLEFSLRGLAPGTVTVSQGGREIWRGLATPERTLQSVPVRLTAGKATLEFSTDAPARSATVSSDPRTLTFALYNAKLVLSEKER